MSADGEEFSSLNDKLVNIEKLLKSLQEALQLHSVNAVNLHPQNTRMNQNFTHSCKFCRTEGHSNVLSQKTGTVKYPKLEFLSPTTKITLENILTDVFVHFRGTKMNINTGNSDHNKPHSKLGIVSLKTEMVPGITFKISSANLSKTHIDKFTQGLTKIIQISKVFNILLFKIQIMRQTKSNHRMFSI